MKKIILITSAIAIILFETERGVMFFRLGESELNISFIPISKNKLMGL